MRQLRTIALTPGYENQYSRIMKYYTDVLNNPKVIASFQRDATRSRNRLLQGGEEINAQRVTLDGCLFDNNVRGSDSSSMSNGVIYIATTSNEITIKNSIFRNNNFASQDDGIAVSWPIKLQFDRNNTNNFILK